MNKFILLFITVSLHQTLASQESLFNGENLEGWNIHGTELWYVDHALLVCESGPDKAYGYLSTVKFYDDFELTLEFKQEANGKCDLCFKSAPFKNKYGAPYLECHHIKRLADNGDDDYHNAVALCPNCHRKIHSLNLKSDINKLKNRVASRDKNL